MSNLKRTGKTVEPPLAVQFCNSKSVELFGADLQKADVYNINEIKLQPQSQGSINISDSQHDYDEITLGQVMRQKIGTDQTYIIKSQNDQTANKVVHLKRTDMIYNDTNCHVLNFLDLTSQYSLERSKEKYRLMKQLNTTVHHEMIAPLKAQMDISSCLYENLKSSENKQMAKIHQIPE